MNSKRFPDKKYSSALYSRVNFFIVHMSTPCHMSLLWPKLILQIHIRKTNLFIKVLPHIIVEQTSQIQKTIKSSAIRQKGESKNGCYKKTKNVTVSEKRTFLTPWYAHGSKKCSFFGKFDVHCFLVTPVLRLALLPYYRRNILFTFRYNLKCFLDNNEYSSMSYEFHVPLNKLFL